MPYTLSQFKAVLYGLGYNLGPNGPNGNNSNTLDFFTQAAIQEFQADCRLPQTGQLDAQTIEKAKHVVRNLQHSLNLVVDAKLPVNEFYGPRTLQAVMSFQKQQKLPMTGVAASSVRKRLDEEVKNLLRHRMSDSQEPSSPSSYQMA